MTLNEKKKYLRNYRWSSYGGYIWKRDRRPFLEGGEVLAHFGGDTAKGRRKYEGYVIEGLVGGITNPLERGKRHGIVGGSGFMKKIREQFLRSVAESRELPAVRKIVTQVEPERIIGEICEVFDVERQELLRKGYKGVGRGVLMELLYRYGRMNQREIGELMGIDYSAVSVMRKRLSGLQKRDRNLSAEIEKIKKRLQQSQG